jgi:uncharacterized protein
MPISYRAAQTLIKRGDEPQLRSALHNAPIGRLLLDHGANPSLENNKSETALTLATNRGFQVFIDLLTGH